MTCWEPASQWGCARGPAATACRVTPAARGAPSTTFVACVIYSPCSPLLSRSRPACLRVRGMRCTKRYHLSVPPSPSLAAPAASLPSSPGPQVRALALGLRHRVVLLQGPPGTGKTTTIVRFIRFLKHTLRWAPPGRFSSFECTAAAHREPVVRRDEE